jgi:hypothetical protein
MRSTSGRKPAMCIPSSALSRRIFALLSTLLFTLSGARARGQAGPLELPSAGPSIPRTALAPAADPESDIAALPADAESDWAALHREYDAAVADALAAHETGDFERARRSMMVAHSLLPSARTLRGLGIIAHSRGDFVEAVLHLEAALSDRVRPLDPGLRASVERLLTESGAHVGRYALQIEPASAEVMVDGAPPRRDAAGNLVLLPGSHLVMLSAHDRLATQRAITTVGGELRTLSAELVPMPASALELMAWDAGQAPGPTRAAPRERLSNERRQLRRSARALLASGVVLSGVGLTAWRVARYRANPPRCDDDPTTWAYQCSGEAEREREERRQRGRRAGITLGLIGTASLAGALALWRKRVQRDALDARISLHATGAQLDLTF